MPRVQSTMKKDEADFAVALHRIDVETGAVLRSFELPTGNTKFGRCDFDLNNFNNYLFIYLFKVVRNLMLMIDAFHARIA